MNSFGLGLVLNFVDNASAGMNAATANFNRMSAMADSMTSAVSTSATEMAAIAYSLGAVGDTFTSIGESITGVFTGITQQVISSGNQMLGYRMQLNALYGEDLAGEKMQEITQYAKSSVFEIQSLIPAVTMMKSVGIEAMDEITTSSGKGTQKLLDYASDLAAMMPNMINMYGTGVQAAMGAFKEYIAEGNALSLKRGAGLDIEAILGEDKGATIEERTQQIADLIEKLNILGYTEKLQGTPTQRLSNLQDVLFETLTKIADSGVFNTYCNLLAKLSDWVYNLSEDSETLNAITGILADTITTILSPLESMLDWVIKNSDAIIEWIKENPKLTKNILLTVAAVGALLIVGGSLLKMLSSISFAMSGLSVIKTLPALLGKLALSALPLIAIAGLAYTAWKNNMWGIRDTITNVFSNLGSILTIVGDAWGDNTLSEENFLKAKELGILPFIEAILQLKYYWDYFIEGFKKGFTSVFEGVFKILESFGIDVSGLKDTIADFLSSLVKPGAEDTWVKIGEAIGGVIATMATLSLIVKIIMPIISAFTALGKVVGSVGKLFKSISSMKLFSGLAKTIKDISGVLKGGQGIGFIGKLVEAFKAIKSGMGVREALTAIFGPVGVTIAGIVSLISGIAMAVTGFVKQLTDGFSWFWEIIKWIGIALAVVGAILLGVAAWPAVIVGAIVGVLTLLIVLIKDNWAKICDFFSKMGSWIYDNVIKPVADFFVWLWDGIVKGVSNAINGIKNFFSTIASWIYNNVISPVVNFFTTYIFPIISKIVEIVAKVIEIIVVLVVNVVKQIGIVLGRVASWIYDNIIAPVINFFVGLWNAIVAGVTSFVESAKNIIITIVEWINTNIVQPIANFFSALWEGIVSGVSAFIEGVKNVFITIVEWIDVNIIQPIAGFFTSLWEGISTAFTTVVDGISSGIKSAFNAVLSFVVGLINGVIWAINGAISFINAIPGVEIKKIEELKLPELAEGGIVDEPTTALIGEAGKEAVMPLENNKGWIMSLADDIYSRMSANNQGSVPATQNPVVENTNTNTTTSQFITSNNSVQGGNTDNSSVEEKHIDNSVTFEAGSIVIQLSNSTDAELEKMAEKLMKIIARKQQLRTMAVRP